MLKKVAVLCVVLFSCQTLNSQILVGSVTDAEYNPIGFAAVMDTVSQKEATCDFSGNFIMTIPDKSVIEISHPEFESEVFSIPTIRPSDTLVLNFILTRKVQVIQEVVVTSERIKTVTDQRNTNVVDYLPFDDFILMLKTSKSGRFLSLEGIDTTLQVFNLGKIKAKKIVEDCYGNVHLLSKDSSYQIWIDSALHFVSTSSIENYNKYLKPCVASFPEKTVFANFTNRNRKYTLTAIDGRTKEKEHFFYLHDKIGEQVARSHYWSIISHYLNNVRDYENMIELGVWDGNLLSLNLYDPEFDRMILWYLKIRAVELNIQSFPRNNDLIVFDQFSDSIYIFDEENEIHNKIEYFFAEGSTVFPIIHDRYTNTFYDVSIANGVYSLTSITPAYDENVDPRKLTISEVPFAANIKIYNHWAYFLIEENGYYGLHRMRIPVASANNDIVR